MNTLSRVRQRARRTTDALSALAFTLAMPVVLAMALFAKEGTGGDAPALNPFITRAQAARKKLAEERDAILAKAEKEERSNLNEDEDKEFRRLTDEIKTHDERVAELLDAEKRERSAAELAGSLSDSGGITGGAVVRREPMMYERGKRTSYFADLGLAYVGGDEEARQRLARHRQEMDVELPKREARMEAEFHRGIESLSIGERRAAIERRDISRVDGAGGEFVPPLWLMDEYAALARAGRPFADLVRNVPLPGGTDSINIPRITTGTAVAAQTADNAAVAETDMVTDSVAAPVRTIAGQQDLALQLVEQSPVGFDEIVLMDLRADYNAKLDAQLLAGSGAAGQLKGILSAGGNAITYTDASPTLPELYPKVADAIQQASTARKRVPNVLLMAPRRWFWALAQVDSTGRPFVLPTAQGALNTLADVRDQAFQGPVGTLLGLPVVLDPNMPINLGAGTNEDRIIATLTTDLILFEGGIRTRALPEVLSGTLTVRFQLYAYVAWTAERYPTGTSIAAGTGLVTPTF